MTNWNVGDRFEVMPSLFIKVPNKGCYTWNVGDIKIIPMPHQRGTVVEHHANDRIGVSFDGSEEFSIGWSVRPDVHEHFRKVEVLYCAECEAKMDEDRIDYLCETCRSA